MRLLCAATRPGLCMRRVDCQLHGGCSGSVGGRPWAWRSCCLRAGLGRASGPAPGSPAVCPTPNPVFSAPAQTPGNPCLSFEFPALRRLQGALRAHLLAEAGKRLAHAFAAGCRAVWGLLAATPRLLTPGPLGLPRLRTATQRHAQSTACSGRGLHPALAAAAATPPPQHARSRASPRPRAARVLSAAGRHGAQGVGVWRHLQAARPDGGRRRGVRPVRRRGGQRGGRRRGARLQLCAVRPAVVMLPHALPGEVPEEHEVRAVRAAQQQGRG